MTIPDWSGPLTGIDRTFGYDDMLLTRGSAALPIGITSTLREPTGVGDETRPIGDITREGVNPSAGVSDEAAQSMPGLKPGDQLFRLPNGGILWRHPIFSDPCQLSQVVDSNRLPVSANMTRALAFFSGYTADLAWCRANDANIAGDQITPWDVRDSQSGIRRLEQALALLRTVRAAGANGTLPANIPAGRVALARELATAAAIPDSELTALATEISTRRDAVESLTDFLARHPMASLLVAAFVFTDGYHLLRYLVLGGKPPLEGPLSPLGGIRNLIRGAIKFFGGGPKDPPQGGGSGAAGGSEGNNAITGGQDSTHGVSKFQVLPEGVVTANEGALIYRPEYQARIDGQWVALPPESGLQFLAGGDYTYSQFMQSANAGTGSMFVATNVPMDAADLLNGGISYGDGQSNPQILSANAFVGGSPLPSGAHFETMAQLPGTLTVLESLPATLEGSFLSWEAVVTQFSRVAPAGAR